MSIAPQQLQLSASDASHHDDDNKTSQEDSFPSTLNSPRNKAVIFDWDDTLYPTTGFSKKSHGNDFNRKAIALLSEKVVLTIKQSCSLYGPSNVFIVTNGGQDWIQESLIWVIKYCSANNIENSFEEILDLISRGYIIAISAQHLYSSQFPNKKMLWKYYTFYYIIQQTQCDTLIFIGNSNTGYIASKKIKKYNIDKIQYSHRVKLTLKPKISCMNEQFDLILPMLDSLKIFNDHDVDIDYPKEKAKFLRN